MAPKAQPLPSPMVELALITTFFAHPVTVEDSTRNVNPPENTNPA
jgi:hypothetical protein